VIPFARSTRVAEVTEDRKPWRLRLTSGADGRFHRSRSSSARGHQVPCPPEMLPRLALISDGNENKGSIARAAWQARQSGIPIDTYTMAGRERPALRLESVEPAGQCIYRRTVRHRPGGIGAKENGGGRGAAAEGRFAGW